MAQSLTSGTTCGLLLAGFFLGLFFDLEEEGSKLLRNVGELLSDYAVLYPQIHRTLSVTQDSLI
jgi:hypothetical protein